MIYYADNNWTPLEENPFSGDGCYGENWSAFIYDGKVEYYTNIFQGAKVYTLRISPKIDFKHERLLDFIYLNLKKDEHQPRILKWQINIF